MDFNTYSHEYLNDPNSELFSSTLVDRFSQEAENNFAIDYPCILKRVSLQTVAGTNIYTLPDDIKSIRRVSWLGFKLDPLSQRNFRELFQNGTQVGRPFWYIFNNVGLNQIQFFPQPNESVVPDSTDLFGIGIPTNVIVEYFQAPDFVTALIPQYFRRRLLKSFVLRGCFGVEGQGQNLKNQKYYKAKWEFLKDKYGMLLKDLHSKPRKLVVNGISFSSYFPGNPVLPIGRFGPSVDAGE